MSDGRKYYCFCESNCKFETMTKEQILAAITQAAENGRIIDIDTGFVTKMQELNGGGYLTFWVGTRAQYNALATKDKNCFYILSDSPSFAELSAALQGHIDNNENPHGVTAEQVGATPASHATNKNNPHGVTAEQVGASALGHKHKKADIEDFGHTHSVADIKGLPTTENWTFTLEDGSTVTKAVYVG